MADCTVGLFSGNTFAINSFFIGVLPLFYKIPNIIVIATPSEAVICSALLLKSNRLFFAIVFGLILLQLRSVTKNNGDENENNPGNYTRKVAYFSDAPHALPVSNSS